MPNSCPATHCICTSTSPQPWSTVEMMGGLLTLSGKVQVFDTVTTPGPPCPYTKSDDAGPSIWIAAQTSGTCGPASIWSMDGPAVTAAPSVPPHREVGPGPRQQPCSIKFNTLCVCDPQPPRPITVGETCGSSTASMNCKTAKVKPYRTSDPQMIGCACAAPDFTMGEFLFDTPIHVLQPNEECGKKEDIAKDQPICRVLDNTNGEVACKCYNWLLDNPGLRHYDNNPCRGATPTPVVTRTAAVTCENVEDHCVCSRTETPTIAPITRDQKCDGHPPVTSSYKAPVTID